MNTSEITYWVTLASMPKMWTKRKNQLYVACYMHSPRYSIADLFENEQVRRDIGVTPDEEVLFLAAHDQLVNNAFMVEDLHNQGYEILPLTSPDYPKSLKNNLKQGAPCVLYVKGNKVLLQNESTAIVGSRKADGPSLEFTTNVARKAVDENKTVVSGFAKGVDRQALDAAIEAGGTSIIVLPQGITTFASGFRQYYKSIHQGKVVVISTFHPKAPWSVELAMARNSIIYGLASEIFAAQSDNKGGTWAGVNEGLKKGQRVYVRIPSDNEKNANLLLINNGGIGVDIYGNVVPSTPVHACDMLEFEVASEPDASGPLPPVDEPKHDDLKNRVLDVLSERKMSKDVLASLKLNWSDAKMKKYLRSLPEIEEQKISGKIFFIRRNYSVKSLFD